MEYRTWPEVLSDWNEKYFLGFKETMKEKASEAWEFAKQIPLTFAVPIVALGIAGFAWTYNHECERDKAIPIAFSEKSQIERDASGENEKVSPLTRYLTSVNDSKMKIFERWNKAHGKASRDIARAFAEQLYDERANNKHNYSLHDLQQNLVEESKAALESIRPYREVRNRLIPINNLFENTWDDSHIDHYRTVTRTGTRTVSDGNGKSHTETYTFTEEVYDHTHHSYTYYPRNGESASREIDGLFGDYPELKLAEKIRMATKTNPENEQAMHESRIKELKNKVLSRVEKLTLANKWREGSTLLVNLPRIHQYYNSNLANDANSWRAGKQRAHSTSYPTGSHSDSGPREFQIVESALDNGRNTVSLIWQIEKGIIYTLNNSSLLDSKITEMIKTSFGPESKEKTKRTRKLSDEIMLMARQEYSLNFKEGFDVAGFRGWMVVLGTLLGAGLGFGIGVGIEKYKESQGYGSYNRYSRYG